MEKQALNIIEIPNLEEQGGLAKQVTLAKSDKAALNSLLQDYLPFIKKTVSSFIFKKQAKQDYLTCAMLAFSHSVATYDDGRGSFTKYAATVIRNRIIDEVRRDLAREKHQKDIDWDRNDWDADPAIESYNKKDDENNLRLEIEALNLDFARWGFSWESLQKHCPRQQRSRELCRRIAGRIMQDESMRTEMLETHKLPVKRLSAEGGFPEKAVEKYRQYIIALAIITRGSYPYVFSFIPQFFEEGA